MEYREAWARLSSIMAPATASAITGVITDPRTLGMAYPKFEEPLEIRLNTAMLVAPAEAGEDIELEKEPNITSLPEFDPLPDTLECPVLLKVHDDISTDEIMPAGSSVLPFRSNIPEISKFVFKPIDPDFPSRAWEYRSQGSFIVAGKNYGQGSSREHAAIAPRYLGVRAVIARSFARIHFQNLADFGILPLQFESPEDYEQVKQGDILVLENLHKRIRRGESFELLNKTRKEKYRVRHFLSNRQVEMVMAGSLINTAKRKVLERP
jgi:aconitate hydratase